MYPLVAKGMGATATAVPLDDSLVHDLDAIAEAIGDDTRLVFLCNPNNPTGTSFGADAFERFMAAVPDDVRVIMDLKAPDSGMSGRNDWSNIAHLRPHHEVKLVIASRADYEWSRDVIAEHDLAERCTVLLSPAWGLIEPRELVSWMLEDSLPVRFSLQIHKVIWDANATGV